jgi:hypothetical protein
MSSEPFQLPLAQSQLFIPILSGLRSASFVALDPINSDIHGNSSNASLSEAPNSVLVSVWHFGEHSQGRWIFISVKSAWLFFACDIPRL